jgi:hypothetical protein
MNYALYGDFILDSTLPDEKESGKPAWHVPVFGNDGTVVD